MPREHRRAVTGPKRSGPDRRRGSIPKPRPAGLRYRDGFLGEHEARQLLDLLLDEVQFERPAIRLFGRTHSLPRAVAYYGDPGCHYRYSGIVHPARPWLPPLAALRGRLAADLGISCNAVLVTLYRDGRDRIGWHRDDERDLVPGAPVAGISVGASRRMLLRPGPGQPSTPLELRSGSVLVLSGDALRWQHAIPPARTAGVRVSLTYRRVIPSPALVRGQPH